jgi:hypothetical protein
MTFPTILNFSTPNESGTVSTADGFNTIITHPNVTVTGTLDDSVDGRFLLYKTSVEFVTQGWMAGGQLTLNVDATINITPTTTEIFGFELLSWTYDTADERDAELIRCAGPFGNGNGTPAGSAAVYYTEDFFFTNKEYTFDINVTNIINEGEVGSWTFTAVNHPNETFYYEIINNHPNIPIPSDPVWTDIDASDFDDNLLEAPFTLSGTSGTITKSVAQDGMDDGPNFLHIRIWADAGHSRMVHRGIGFFIPYDPKCIISPFSTVPMQGLSVSFTAYNCGSEVEWRILKDNPVDMNDFASDFFSPPWAIVSLGSEFSSAFNSVSGNLTINPSQSAVEGMVFQLVLMAGSIHNTTKVPVAGNSFTISAATDGGGGGTSTAAPTFSPAAGNYTTAQNVSISCSTPGATIYYTTNGSTPSSASAVYSTAIPVSAATTIKAFASSSGLTDSSVASAAFTIGTSGGGGGGNGGGGGGVIIPGGNSCGTGTGIVIDEHPPYPAVDEPYGWRVWDSKNLLAIALAARSSADSLLCIDKNINTIAAQTVIWTGLFTRGTVAIESIAADIHALTEVGLDHDKGIVTRNTCVPCINGNSLSRALTIVALRKSKQLLDVEKELVNPTPLPDPTPL